MPRCLMLFERLPRQIRGGPQFIASERITPRGAAIAEPAAPRDGFQARYDTAFGRDYYAVKSHLAAARRIVEGCGNTCAALFRAVDAALDGDSDGNQESERVQSGGLAEDSSGDGRCRDLT